ncbi:MAG: flagellar basal body-associated FliL family protein [Pseudomonadota bacterium]
MAEPDMPPEAAARKKSKLPMLMGAGLALMLGAGGFFATYSGLLFGAPAPADAATTVGDVPDISFVPIDPLVINLAPGSASKHLRFSAQLEVANPYGPEVALLMPRILDVLNGYLRAVETADLENPSALVKLRAQMLRRVQIVTGEGRVRDLLVTEFVLN